MKTCSRCIMDESDKDIIFDSDGICNHCNSYDNRLKKFNSIYSTEKLNLILTKLKSKRKYDCIIGLSGGVDSSYLLYWAKHNGLNPLCIHLDNGWNSELAVDNINKLIDYSNFDLITHVIDWNEFKSIQRSFFKANVIDLELVSDQAIFASLYKYALKYNIRHILSGENFKTEAILPPNWIWRKSDVKNILGINKLFGDLKVIKTYPTLNTFFKTFYQYSGLIKSIPILNYLDYNKKEALKILSEETGWRPYPGKHYESIFTRFYQGYILPRKFNIDKRKAHLSTLVNSGQMSREEAVHNIKSLDYPIDLQKEDLSLVCKKLDFSEDFIDSYIKAPRVEHNIYPTDQKIFNLMRKIYLKLGLRKYNKYA